MKFSQKYLQDAIKPPYVFYHIHRQRLLFSYSTIHPYLSFLQINEEHHMTLKANKKKLGDNIKVAPGKAKKLGKHKKKKKDQPGIMYPQNI